MRAYHVHYFLVAIIVLFTACSTGLIKISVLEPAPISLPASIKSVSIFPEVVFSDSQGVFDSVQYLELDSAFNYNVIKKGYLLGLYDAMAASPRYKKVVIADSAYGQLALNSIISWDDLRQICMKDTTNTVLLLTKAVSYDNIQYSVYPDFRCYLNYQVINKTEWSFYLPELKLKVVDFPNIDTVTFEGYEYNCESILDDMPGADELLYYACYHTGKKVGTQISPSWNDDVKRFIFIGPDREMKDAAQLVLRDQWVEAARIWNRLSEAPNRKLASKACFNIALAYERDDYLDQAASWIAYADSLFSNGKTLHYKKILDDRLKTRIILDQQMIETE